MTSKFKTALLEVTNKRKTEVIKADRNLQHRVVVALEAGRDLLLDVLLKHELSNSNKAQLAKILEEDEDVCHVHLPRSDLRTCTIIDVMALVQAIGKPKNAAPFWDIADAVVKCVKSNFSASSTRVDLIIDRYDDLSIKSGTRDHRHRGVSGIRRVIIGRDTKLPNDWNKYLCLVDNKRLFIEFLAREFSSQICDGLEIVTAGGFTKSETVVSSTNRDVTRLFSNHEEADIPHSSPRKRRKEGGIRSLNHPLQRHQCVCSPCSSC